MLLKYHASNKPLVSLPLSFTDTFYTNPQCLISLEDADDSDSDDSDDSDDDADDVCSCIIAVMQKDRRKGINDTVIMN